MTSKLKIILSMFIILLVYIVIYCSSLFIVEPKAYDFMMKNVVTSHLPFDKTKRVYGSDNIVLVIVGDETVEKYRWPWKRSQWIPIIDYFKTYSNEKFVVFDMLLPAIDSSSYHSDKQFFNCIRNMDNFIGSLFLESRYLDKNNIEKEKKHNDIIFKKYSINVQTEGNIDVENFESLYPTPLEYIDVLQNAGHINLETSGSINETFLDNLVQDNISRLHMPILVKDYQYVIPSTALKTYLLLNNNPEIIVSSKGIYIPKLKQNIRTIKSSYKIAFPVRFYKQNDSRYSHKVYTALDIIGSYNAIKQGKKPKINPEEFKNKIVFIGGNTTSGGLDDNKNCPLGIFQGTDYLATALDNMINNDFLFVIPQYMNIILTILGMLLVYIIIRYTSLFKSILLVVLFCLSYLLLGTICFYFKVIINIITPIVMFIVTTIIAYTQESIIANKNKEQVQMAMGMYMSKDVMKRIVQDIDNLGLGGKKSTVTVLFSDIRGFTSLSEKMSAQEVSEILNEYFSEMEPIITKYNGIINKFIGDAIMAIFGEPIQDKEHAENAVKCGFEMLQRVKELQKKWENTGKPCIEIGIGINTGEVFVGNIGSVNRMEYTVIGDTVNLASRLESYNKIYKTKMLISSTTYEKAKGFIEVMRIPDVQIRGKANKMDIYEVLEVKK